MADTTLIKKATDILERTNDGNDLSPTHLKLLELAVNNQLNEKGICTRLGGDDFGADGLKNRILGPAYFIELKYGEGRTPSANF